MNVKQIPTLPVASYMSEDVKSLRENAPMYIKRIIEDTHAVEEVESLAEIEHGHISPLSGGNLSAVYLIKTTKRNVIIKMRYQGIKAEAESLRAWRRHGASVPCVFASGVVPGTEQKRKVKYVILEAVQDKQGQLAPPCITYVTEHQSSTFKIGELLGRELAKMHEARTRRTFGEFADMWGANKAPIKSWNSYLLGYLDMHYEHLLREGITKTRLKKLADRIRGIKFSRRGTYLHGDYSMRNALVVNKHPLSLTIFDPNPLVGDPSWDLAVLYNNEEYARRRYEFQPHKKQYREDYEREKLCLEGLISGYVEATGKPIDREKVRASQLVQTIFLLDIEENKAKAKGENPETEIEVMVRKDALLAMIVLLNLGTRDKRHPLPLL